MNILFFIHNMTGGGAERVMSIVANAFAREGHSVTIAVMDYGNTKGDVAGPLNNKTLNDNPYAKRSY